MLEGILRRLEKTHEEVAHVHSFYCVLCSFKVHHRQEQQKVLEDQKKYNEAVEKAVMQLQEKIDAEDAVFRRALEEKTAEINRLNHQLKHLKKVTAGKLQYEEVIVCVTSVLTSTSTSASLPTPHAPAPLPSLLHPPTRPPTPPLNSFLPSQDTARAGLEALKRERAYQKEQVVQEIADTEKQIQLNTIVNERSISFLERQKKLIDKLYTVRLFDYICFSFVPSLAMCVCDYALPFRFRKVNSCLPVCDQTPSFLPLP